MNQHIWFKVTLPNIYEIDLLHRATRQRLENNYLNVSKRTEGRCREVKKAMYGQNGNQKNEIRNQNGIMEMKITITKLL